MTRNTASRLSHCVLIAGVVFGLSACNKAPTSPSGNANLIVNLTDDDTEDVEEVNLFFTSVTAKPVNAPTETRLDLLLTTNPQNLLALDDTEVTLASGVVEPGMYDFLMINLDESESYLIMTGSDDEVPLQIPSEEIKILGGFSVGEEGVTTVTLDFDAEESLVELGSGEWLVCDRPAVAYNLG